MRKIIEITALVLLVVLIAAASVSCTKEKEADTVAPIIDIVLPREGDTLFINGETHLELNVSDERELDSCRFEVHSNFDHHTHKSTLHGDEPFFYTRFFILTGIKSTTLHDYAFVIPDTIGLNPIAQGSYHFVMDCYDKAGNKSTVVRNITIAAKY